MPPPTLFVKGNLRDPIGNPDKQKILDDYIPIEYLKEWFHKRLNLTGIENRFLILKAGTASAKSTGFPPEMYRAFIRPLGRNAAGIICTQPRTLTAMQNVYTIISSADYGTFLKLGDTIGWSTKFNKLKPKKYGLISATIGTLQMQLRVFTDEEIMEKYRFIMIDETHERDLQTDMTIYMLKNFLMRNANNPNCPFIVFMSATFDPQPFINYFGGSNDNFIWVEGRSYGIDEIWDWNQDRVVNNFTQSAADVVEKICNENPNDPPTTADVLIFMPGKPEFRDTMVWLEKINKKLQSSGKKPFIVLQIDSEAVSKENRDYQLMQVPVNEIPHDKNAPNGYCRKVIISTVVAETGLTLEYLKYVIDSGWNREIEFNPVYGIRSLLTKPVPKSRYIQRRGRAGRKFRGVFYPLYPKYIYEKMEDLQLPQILINDISIIALTIIDEQLRSKRLRGIINPEFKVEDINMLDPPTPDALKYALERLYALGMITPFSNEYLETFNGEQMTQTATLKLTTHFARETNNISTHFGFTDFGRLCSKFSMMMPEHIKMIMAAFAWECSILDIISIAAYLATDLKDFTLSLENDSGPPPEPDWIEIYRAGLPTFLSDNKAYYRARLLIADDFINGLFLFNAIKSTVKSLNSAELITGLQKWCKSVRIKYQTVISFIKSRDEIIEQLITEGVDVFGSEHHSMMNLSEDNFMNGIVKIKHCIYDGFRLNLLTFENNIYKYNGLEVTTPKLFANNSKNIDDKLKFNISIDIKPLRVLFNGLSLKYNFKTKMYRVLAERVSVMDGFVPVDVEFM